MKNSAKKDGEDILTGTKIKFTVDPSLDKYKGPEFDPPKLKEIEKKFSKPVTIKR